jgi:hypothetical protein
MHDRVNLATRTTSLHMCPIIARREQTQWGHHALEGHWADAWKLNSSASRATSSLTTTWPACATDASLDAMLTVRPYTSPSWNHRSRVNPDVGRWQPDRRSLLDHVQTRLHCMRGVAGLEHPSVAQPPDGAPASAASDVLHERRELRGDIGRKPIEYLALDVRHVLALSPVSRRVPTRSPTTAEGRGSKGPSRPGPDDPARSVAGRAC